MTIREPLRDLEVAASVDVAVVGGGIAGVAAAIAAAREGARVILIEKMFGLGGLATLGNVIEYLPICDGRGRQVIGGLGEELLLLAAKRISDGNTALGLKNVPDCWTRQATVEERSAQRYRCAYNPSEYQIDLEEHLRRENVEIYYDTRFCGCYFQDDRLSHLIVENKSGRLAIKAAAFVDASGDADVCAAAGERTASRNINVLGGWYYLLRDGRAHLRKFTKPFRFSADDAGNEEPFFSGEVGKDVSEFILQYNRLVREQIDTLRAEHPGEDIQPFMLPAIPSFRSTRRLSGAFELGEAHVHTWFDDAIGLTGDWRKPGPIYAIPLRAIQGEINPNVFAAGRCISTETLVWDVTRVIPPCVVTGEAAGTAAALAAVRFDGDASLVTGEAVRARLLDKGGLISRELVEKAE